VILLLDPSLKKGFPIVIEDDNEDDEDHLPISQLLEIMPKRNATKPSPRKPKAIAQIEPQENPLTQGDLEHVIAEPMQFNVYQPLSPTKPMIEMHPAAEETNFIEEFEKEEHMHDILDIGLEVVFSFAYKPNKENKKL